MTWISYKFLSVCLLVFLSPCSITSAFNDRKVNLSPLDYGLEDAKNGVDRYEVLLRTHREAVEAGVNVDYTGIDTIKIEIPDKSSRIPLTQYNDFKGCVFLVKNTSRACWLFDKKGKKEDIQVEKWCIDAGDFRAVEKLRRGRHLLVIEDENPWVLNRKGYSYGHQRKDILLIEDGVAKNTTIMPYNNDYSKPKCEVINLKNEPLVFKNIKIERDPECTFLTHVANIVGFDDVRISNVSLFTPKSTQNGDRGIRLYDCTNIVMDSIHIDGTYSQPDHSGYGINLGNVWNFCATRLYGKANWGVFGNSDVNTARIENSRINRFDIHCYGKDVSFKNVDFFDMYNQFASVYGTIHYDKCTFTSFVPVLNGGTYNAYVGHDVEINNCIFNMTPKKNSVFKLSSLNEPMNQRYELSAKCLPNVRIKNLVVNMRGGVDKFFVFYCTSSVKSVSSVGYLTNISIDGLTINHEGEETIKELFLSNVKIGTENPINCKVSNVMITHPGVKKKTMSSAAKLQLKTNMIVKGGKVKLQNAKCIKQ